MDKELKIIQELIKSGKSIKDLTRQQQELIMKYFGSVESIIDGSNRFAI
jgi:hypothetical protein